MEIKTIDFGKSISNDLIKYANSCNREAGPILAQKMRNDDFSNWEKVFVATENDKIIGFCTFTEEDGIPNCDYSPFVGFIFVDENYRGKRVSEKMINAVEICKNFELQKIIYSIRP